MTLACKESSIVTGIDSFSQAWSGVTAYVQYAQNTGLYQGWLS